MIIDKKLKMSIGKQFGVVDKFKKTKTTNVSKKY